MKLGIIIGIIIALVIGFSVGYFMKSSSEESDTNNISWVDDLIQREESNRVANPPASLTKCEYKGQIVYYLPPRCCDISSILYNSEGEVICSPDGGFTGSGDSKCPNFFEERKNCEIIWKDTRIEQIDELQDEEDNGIVYGKIGLYTGNCMPGVSGGGVSDCNLGDIQTTVYITTPTKKFNSSILVKSTLTDEKGNFELELYPGNYSLFVYDNFSEWDIWNECGSSTTCDGAGAYICDWLSGNVCMPFTIETEKRVELNANIDHASW